MSQAKYRYFIRQSRVKCDHKPDASFQIVVICGVAFVFFIIAAAIAGWRG
jgi:hypothetical protein